MQVWRYYRADTLTKHAEKEMIKCSAYIVYETPRELYEDVKYFYGRIKEINTITPLSQRFIRTVIIISVISIESFLNEAIEDLFKDVTKVTKFNEWIKDKHFKFRKEWEWLGPADKWRLFFSLLKNKVVLKDDLSKSKIYNNFCKLIQWRNDLVHRHKNKNIYQIITIKNSSDAIGILEKSLKFLYKLRIQKVPFWLKEN